MAQASYESAPPRRAVLPVIIGGLVTTALTLAGVWYLSQVSDRANIMGWYANYVIPVGPIFVGVVAGCGYGIMSYRTGVKVSGKLLWTVLLLQAVAYVAAQYLEYHRFAGMLVAVVNVDGAHLSFGHWFDTMTRSFSWVEESGKGSGEPFGAWGYGIRALEVLGFTLGGLIVPGIMRTLPYCDGCGVYMRKRQLLVLPAGIKPRKIKKSDVDGQAAYAAEHEAAVAAGMARLENVRAMVRDGKITDLQALVARNKAEAKEAAGQTLRLVCTLVQCPLCRSGYLQAEAYNNDNPPVPQDLGNSEAARGLEV